MGNKISSETSQEQILDKREKKRKQILSSKINTTGMELYNRFSSYEGIKSDSSKETISNIVASQSQDDSLQTTSSNSVEWNNKSDKIPTAFTWREGGSTVYVTGSFANWKQWFLMNKSSTENNDNPWVFRLTLELARGTHQYKFIVDKLWRISKDSPTIKDENGNINNIINNSEICLLPKGKNVVKISRVKSLFISL